MPPTQHNPRSALDFYVGVPNIQEVDIGDGIAIPPGSKHSHTGGPQSHRFSDVTGWHGWYYLSPRCPTSRVHWAFPSPRCPPFKPELRKGRMLKSTMPPARCGSLTLPSRVDWGLLGAWSVEWGDVGKKHSMLGSRSERHEPPQKKKQVFI